MNSDHSSLRWLLSVNDPSVRLMRKRLRLSEFDFEVKYRKEKLITQAVDLSRLMTLGETCMQIDDDIPCFTCETLGPDQSCHRNGDHDDFDEAHDFLLVLEQPNIPSDEPYLPAFTPQELFTRSVHGFFCSLRSHLTRGKTLQITIDPEGYLVRNAAERDNFPSLPLKMLAFYHLSHYTKLAVHQGGRRLYYYLNRHFYWPSLALGCYAVARSCTSCAKNRLLLCKNFKNLQLFPPCAQLEYISIDLLGELIRTKPGRRFLLVITDRFS